MIFNRVILPFVFVFINLSLFAQEMQEGFRNLENGAFAKAETFFANILREYPENKTARLCYARALGLNNDPPQAKFLFNMLLTDYPGDLEVQLNYAESLLWNKEYEQAEIYYANLVARNPENFGVLLGYANTLSNLKKYDVALETVNKSLLVSPKNTNALISRKYIRLGYASKNLQNRKYQEALTFLDENLLDFPGDKESLLNKANLYLIIKDSESAKNVYRELALNLNDSITAFNGISLAAHIDEDDKEALKYAQKSFLLAAKSQDALIILKAKERYTQALIWNAKYKQAKDYIENFQSDYPQSVSVLALKATLGMYTGNFKKSINHYQQILAIDSTSFDGNLGIANAYFAYEQANKAKKAALETLKFYKNQQDAEQFLEKLNKGFSPLIEENISYSFDNGNNEAIAFRTTLKLPLSTRLELLGAYTYRETMNSTTDLEASSNQVNLSANYLFAPGLRLKLNGGFIKAHSSQTDYTNLVGEMAVDLKPFSRDALEIGYKRDLQDFNAALLNRQIAGNHFFLNNNYSTTYGLGWYLQYLHTDQSDDNTRELLFTSLYYSFLKKPLLKGGFNYQFISFKKQVPVLYFSPKQFHAAEVFISLVGNNANVPFSYELTAATGYQFIEDDAKQSTYRLHGKMDYQLGNRFRAGIYANHSNIASATAAGFTYTEFGLNLKWNFVNKPLFKL